MSASKYALIIAIGLVGLSGCGGGGGSSAVRPSGGGSAGTTTLPLSSGIARLDGGSANGVSYSIAFGGTETDVTLTPTIDGSAIAPIVYSAADASTNNPVLKQFAFSKAGADGKTYDLAVIGTRSATETLAYARYGYWAQRPNATGTPDIIAAFHTGSATPLAGVPAGGTATYTGLSVGQFVDTGIDASTDYAATISLSVNFSAKTISGTLSNFTGISSSSGALAAAVTGTVSGNQFSGTMVANDAATTLGNGTMSGKFYGPAAEEMAGTYGIAIGANQGMIGAFGARRP